MLPVNKGSGYVPVVACSYRRMSSTGDMGVTLQITLENAVLTKRVHQLRDEQKASTAALHRETLTPTTPMHTYSSACGILSASPTLQAKKRPYPAVPNQETNDEARTAKRVCILLQSTQLAME